MKIIRDAIWINGVMFGRWNMFVAKKLESRKQMSDKDNPRVSSKSKPATIMFFTFAGFFSDVYWAVNFIIAEFMPQSLNAAIMYGPVKAIVIKPFSGRERRFATSITLNDEMIVDMATPQKRLKLPLAETLAILTALLTSFPNMNVFFNLVNVDSVVL